MSVPDAAARLGLAPVTVRWYIETGRLKAEKIGGSWLIQERDLGRLKRQRPGRPAAR